jgi:hypothetical protein
MRIILRCQTDYIVLGSKLEIDFLKLKFNDLLNAEKRERIETGKI